MNDLVSLLTSQGIEAYLLTLSGHGVGLAPITSITPGMWDSDMQRGYDAAHRAAQEASLPLYFVGYSFGALLGQRLLSMNHHASFDKQVLLAPATAIRDRSRIIKFLFVFGENF